MTNRKRRKRQTKIYRTYI